MDRKRIEGQVADRPAGKRDTCEACGEVEPLWRQHFPIEREADARRSRREFMKLLTLVSGVFSLGNIGLVVRSMRAKLGGRAPGPSLRMEIPGAADLRIGASLGFTMPDEVPGLLVRLASGALVAYDRRCTHLSCPVLWNEREGRIDCPCHRGMFDPATGEPLAGPPERPLVRVALEIRDARVWATGYAPPVEGKGKRDAPA